MVNGNDSRTESPWREWQFWILAALVAAIYVSRIADLPIRGEETRRAMVAWEILQTGDWIVPHQQHEPFLSRPPVGSWPIAWLAHATGDLSLVAVRLPTILATLLTTLLLYGYSRQFLSRLGALSAGLVFATFVQVLQLGRLAETEATFTLFLAGGLLFWHWGYSLRWPAWQTWCGAYALVAIATLVKSLQAPVYFCGAVGLFLIWQKDWRFLLGKAHIAGLLIFAAILAAWQIPFYQRLGWPAVQQVWSGDVGIRLEKISAAIIATHLAIYPVQVWCCLLPWSLLLTAYLWPQFRRAIGHAAPLVTFAVCAWLVALPTCWLVPNARPRYLMPLYPLAAPLIGLVIQRTFESASQAVATNQVLWRRFLRIAIFSIIGGAVSVVIASWVRLPRLAVIAQPGWFALLYFIAALAAAAVLWRQRNDWSLRTGTVSMLILSAFMGLTVSGVAVNAMISIDPHSGQQVAELRQRLPQHVKLISFGQVGTMFSYHWREPIILAGRKLPGQSADLPSDCDYFCFNSIADRVPRLPFPWRMEAMIYCNRSTDDPAASVVIVGRRVDTVALLPDETATR